MSRLGERVGLVGMGDVHDALVDALDRRRRRGDAHRRGVGQHLVGELGDLARHGRRQEQRLALARQHPDDPADVADEAHVEHLVGLVEDEDLDVAEVERPGLDEVEEAPGRGDEDVDAAGQRADLLADRHAADGEPDRRG